MTRLLNWLQSSSPETAAQDLEIVTTIIKGSLPGEGRIIPIRDDLIRRKSFSRHNPNGSVLYVNVVEGCFFVALMLTMLYHSFKQVLARLPPSELRRDLLSRFYDLLEERDLFERAKQFFARCFDLDIARVVPGSLPFLKKLHQKTGFQISVFQDRAQFHRVLLYPRQYNPLLPQIHLLNVHYPAHASRQRLAPSPRTFPPHYHGIKKPNFGLRRHFCVLCGKHFHFTRSKHHCLPTPGAGYAALEETPRQCPHCHRPAIPRPIYDSLQTSQKVYYCILARDTKPANRVLCKQCKTVSYNALCSLVHAQSKCAEYFVCKKCHRRVKVLGKYRRRKQPQCHDSCQEVYCHQCRDYVVGFKDLKTIEHVCFAKPAQYIPPPPAGIMTFDIEAYSCPKTGLFRANCITAMYHSKPFDPKATIKGIYFSDVVDTVVLQESEVRSGQEFPARDIPDEIFHYIPWEDILNDQKRPPAPAARQVREEEEEEEGADSDASSSPDADDDDDDHLQDGFVPIEHIYNKLLDKYPDLIELLGQDRLPELLQQPASHYVDNPDLTIGDNCQPPPENYCSNPPEFLYQSFEEDDDDDEEEEEEELQPLCEHDTHAHIRYRQAKAVHRQAAQDFKDDNLASPCLIAFLHFLFQKRFESYVVLAHFGQAFDFEFILRACVQLGLSPRLITKGRKILGMSVQEYGVRFLDFFNYVPIGLKKMNDSFGLGDHHKGIFPHKLNRPEHYGLILPHHPSSEFYQPELMRSADRDEFFRWYEEIKHQRFDFNTILHQYCFTDTKILFMAVLAFVKQALVFNLEHEAVSKRRLPNSPFAFPYDILGYLDLIHPFAQRIFTASSYAITISNSYYLEHKSVPLVRDDRPKSHIQRSSLEELEYLQYLERSKPHLRYAMNGNQQRFFIETDDPAEKGHFFVDGYDPISKVNHHRSVKIITC